MRALESELSWTFPAIKKQVDSLDEAGIVDIDKDGAGWSITVKEDIFDDIKKFFYYGMKYELVRLFQEYEVMIHKYYFGKTFGVPLDMDIVVVYKNLEKPQIDAMKEAINDIFRSYYIELVSVVFMSHEEREKRYRLADRFVLHILRYYP